MRLQPQIVHPLPAAPLFVGRFGQLVRLRQFWSDSQSRVSSLIALGGAGKTAIARHFLDWLLGSSDAQPRPTALFVWSFYVDQDTSKSLQALGAYLTASRSA